MGSFDAWVEAFTGRRRALSKPEDRLAPADQ